MKITGFISKYMGTRADKIYFVTIGFLLIGIGYMAGYWVGNARKGTPIVFETKSEAPKIISDEDIAQLAEAVKNQDSQVSAASANGQVAGSTSKSGYVASVSGKKYYALNCSEVKRIKEENKIYFATEKDAIDAGYEASVCVKGK